MQSGLAVRRLGLRARMDYRGTTTQAAGSRTICHPHYSRQLNGK